MTQRWLIEKDGERQNVTNLGGYEDWTVVTTLEDTIPDSAAELVDGNWLVPIEVRRARAWARVKELRAEKEVLAPTPFGVVQSDTNSKLNINGLVAMAQLAGSAFNEGFTLADNSVVTLNAQQMIQLGVAVGQHVSAIYARARTLRDAIDAGDPDAIDVEAGWP